MSDAPDVFTRRNLPRNELETFFRGNPRIRKAIEDLLLDVGVTLPDAIGNQTEGVAAVLSQRTYSPTIFPAPPANDAAGQILAGQIFGA